VDKDEGGGDERSPEMEFLDTNLTKDLNLLLHAIFTVSSIGGFYRKPYSTLVFKILNSYKKSAGTRKLEPIHE
jgi:hypothetical protein